MSNGQQRPEPLDDFMRAIASGRISRRDIFRYAGAGAGAWGLAALLAACTSNGSASPSTSVSGATDGGGGGGTLTVAARQTANGLDPDFYFSEEDQQIRSAVYENLLALDTTTDESGLVVPVYDDSRLQGRLAESWELSSDKRTLTVTLRQGVMSHAGNELTAEDVQYTWTRGWNDDGASHFYATVILGFLKPNWRVADKYVWEITTPEPNAVLALMMMNNDLNILDSKEVKAHVTSDDPYAKKWLASNGAGHGAYTVQTWDPGNQIVLSKFPDYYGTPGNFDTIVYKAVPEGANRAALVQAGSVDVAENVPYRNLSDMEGDGAVKIWKTVGNRLFRFELNNASPPLDDVRVRQALLYATPVNDLLDSLFFGFASQERSPVPSTYNGYNGDYWTYDHDPDKARDLLSQAGLADGFDLTITIDSSFELMSDTATILKTAFADVGVNVTIDEVSSATYSTQVYQRKYDAFFLLEFPILPDPGYALALNYPSDSFLNSTAYSNDQVDSLIKEGFATLEAGARDQIYSQIQEIMVAQDPPEVWIAQPGWQLVTKPDLQGVSWSTWEGYDMAQLRF